MVPLHEKVLGAGSDTLIRSQGQGAVVVFKDGATDGGLQMFFFNSLK